MKYEKSKNTWSCNQKQTDTEDMKTPYKSAYSEKSKREIKN